MAGDVEPGKRNKQPEAATRRHVHPPETGKRDTPKRSGHGSHVHPVVEDLIAVCVRLGSSRQGVVTRRQLLSAGVSRHAIDHAIKTGYLHPVHRGVYIVGHLALAPLAKETAALFACGERSLLSHRSAARIWSLLPGDPEDGIDITVVGHHCRPKEGVRLHRAAEIDSRDLRRRHGLPITSPARTVVDLAAAAGEYELERIIAEGRGLRLIGDGELERALGRSGSRPGNGALRALLRAEGEPGITRSEGERTLRRYLRAAQLPQPLTNRKLGKWEPDFLWPAHRVVVELDSWQFHSHRKAFERDRRKDMALRDAGYTVIRITGRQLKDEPLMVIAHVARALDRATRPHG
jgi:very-short-patch-repair endonuclease